MTNTVLVQDVLDDKVSLNDARNTVLFHKGETFTFFDEGCTRYVYTNADNTLVIKLLKRNLGQDYNKLEDEIYKNASEETKKQLAKTVLVNGLIEQEFCTPIKFGGKKLTIAQRLFASSCRNEVGWNLEGDLVCFDLDEFKKY